MCFQPFLKRSTPTNEFRLQVSNTRALLGMLCFVVCQLTDAKKAVESSLLPSLAASFKQFVKDTGTIIDAATAAMAQMQVSLT